MRAWGIDISGWNDPPPDYKTLVENGASFAIVKGSMGGGISTTAQKQVFDIRQANFKFVGIYHWADPIHRNIHQQLQYIERIVNLTNPDFIAIDNEQWWASWAAYYRFMRKELDYYSVPKLHSAHISWFGKKLLEETQKTFGLPVINYTARWFIDAYAPPMNNWINLYPLWFAAYVNFNPPWLSWEIFHENITNLKPFGLPKTAKDWKIWQITDRKRLPNFPSQHLDINIYNGTVKDMAEWLGKNMDASIPVNPPELEPYFETYQNNKGILGIIVRNNPKGIDLKERIKFRETFKVYEKVYLPPHWWGRISPTDSKWVALSWSDRIN